MSFDAFCSVKGTSCIILRGQHTMRLCSNCSSLPWPGFIDLNRLNLALDVLAEVWYLLNESVCAMYGVWKSECHIKFKYEMSWVWLFHQPFTVLLQCNSMFYLCFCLAPEPQIKLLTMLLGLVQVLFPQLNSVSTHTGEKSLSCNLYSTAVITQQLNSSAWKNLHSFVRSPLWPEQ